VTSLWIMWMGRLSWVNVLCRFEPMEPECVRIPKLHLYCHVYESRYRGEYANSDRIRDTSPRTHINTCLDWTIHERTSHETLYHSLTLRLRIVRPSTETEFPIKVLAILVFLVRSFRMLMKRTRRQRDWLGSHNEICALEIARVVRGPCDRR
jgi:hypothetical protein